MNLVLNIALVGWSKLIPEPMLSSFKHGIIGYHPASLPANRGRYPLISALSLGLDLTSSTFFKLESGADNGYICNQVDIKITDKDDASSLYKKILDLIPLQLAKIVDSLLNGRIIFLEQDDSLSNSWRKRTSKDGLIDWRMSSKNIYNLVRSLTKLYPGAHFMLDGKEVK